MRRLFWMGLGAAATVLVAQQLRTTYRRYTPEGVAEQVEQAGQGALAAVRSAVTTFTQSFASREKDLVDQLLVQPEGGDPSAVFRRAPRPAAGPATPADSAAERARPSGRVDDDEPLYDF